MRTQVFPDGSDSRRRRRRSGALALAFAVVLVPLVPYAQGRLSLPDGRDARLILEGERLAAGARADAGQVSTQDMARFGAGWSGDAQLFWTGGSAGAVLDVSFSVAQSAEYAVDVDFTRAPDYARVSVEVDGRSGAAFDGYGARVAPPATHRAGSFFLTAGTHTLSVRVDGRHPQSSGYLVGLDRIVLSPGTATSATALRATRETAAPPRQLPARADARADTPARPVTGLQMEARRTAAAVGQPDAGCTASCLGSVSTVHRRNEDGQCRVWFRVPCDPYGCEAGSGVCRNSCASSSDCAEGSRCNTNTGMCVTLPYACTDAFTVKAADGQTASCMPYECNAGACRETCQNSNDCAQGYVCNAYARCAKK